MEQQAESMLKGQSEWLERYPVLKRTGESHGEMAARALASSDTRLPSAFGLSAGRSQAVNA
jgi:hypothetical protein